MNGLDTELIIRDVLTGLVDQVANLYDERWVPIEGYPNYMVSNHGRIKNHNSGLFLKQFSERHEDYLKVSLSENGKHSKHSVARLVALNFIPKPDGKDEVNHLGARTDNRVWMLEWTTRAENMKHAHAERIQYYSIPVRATGKDGTIIEYKTVDEAAAAVKGCKSGISAACANKLPTYKGYIWAWINSKKAITQDGEIWAWTMNSIYPEINQYNYYVSNLGRVKNSHDKIVKIGPTYKVCFSRTGCKAKFFKIHRLVLMAFNILNPSNKPEVDHIDSDYTNNKLENLRWVTGQENCNNVNTLAKRLNRQTL